MINKVTGVDTQQVNYNKQNRTKAAAVVTTGLAGIGGAVYLVKSGKGEAVYHALKDKAQPIVERIKTLPIVEKAKEVATKAIEYVRGLNIGAFVKEKASQFVNFAKDKADDVVDFVKNPAKFNPKLANQKMLMEETFNGFKK